MPALPVVPAPPVVPPLPVRTSRAGRPGAPGRPRRARARCRSRSAGGTGASGRAATGRRAGAATCRAPAAPAAGPPTARRPAAPGRARRAACCRRRRSPPPAPRPRFRCRPPWSRRLPPRPRRRTQLWQLSPPPPMQPSWRQTKASKAIPHQSPSGPTPRGRANGFGRGIPPRSTAAGARSLNGRTFPGLDWVSGGRSRAPPAERASRCPARRSSPSREARRTAPRPKMRGEASPRASTTQPSGVVSMPRPFGERVASPPSISDCSSGVAASATSSAGPTHRTTASNRSRRSRPDRSRMSTVTDDASPRPSIVTRPAIRRNRPSRVQSPTRARASAGARWRNTSQ